MGILISTVHCRCFVRLRFSESLFKEFSGVAKKQKIGGVYDLGDFFPDGNLGDFTRSHSVVYSNIGVSIPSTSERVVPQFLAEDRSSFFFPLEVAQQVFPLRSRQCQQQHPYSKG